jgi:hypothetical protein
MRALGGERMDALRAFLNALPAAATSPYAYAAYVLALVAWVATFWLRNQPQRESQKILTEFRDDAARNEALARLLGQAPPEGLAKKQILDWVNIQTRAKSRTYLLIAYLATLVAAIVIVVVALTLARSGDSRSDHGRDLTVRFAAAEGTDCLPLPESARVTVSADGAEPKWGKVVGCEAHFPWAFDWRAGQRARVWIEGAGAFDRADADQTYTLGDSRWIVALRSAETAPRLLIQLFDYAASEAEPRERFAQFQTIVRNKIQMLVESLAARHPRCRYVADLRIVRADRPLPSSPRETLAEWRDSNALAFFSGLVFRRNADVVVRSQPYFGELVLHVPEISRLQLDLKIDEQEFSQTTDSHSLALLYALAMDARRLGYSHDVIFTYLGEAVSVARGMDSSVPGIALLKSALRDTLKQMGAPLTEEL